MKLSYALEKKTIIPVKDSRNCEGEFKGGLYVGISFLYMGISFLRFSSKGKTYIWNGNVSKESYWDGIGALTYTNKPTFLREISILQELRYPSRKN